jgi:hypothetical protein
VKSRLAEWAKPMHDPYITSFQTSALWAQSLLK